MSEGSGGCLLDAVSSRAWRAQVRNRSNSSEITGVASSNAWSKASAARMGSPSAPNNTAFGNRAGHDTFARRTQLAMLGLSMIRLSAGRQSSYGVPHVSVMAVVSVARICKSLVIELVRAMHLAKVVLVVHVSARASVRIISCTASVDLLRKRRVIARLQRISADSGSIDKARRRLASAASRRPRLLNALPKARCAEA